MTRTTRTHFAPKSNNNIIQRELELVYLQFDIIQRGLDEHKLSPSSMKLLLNDCKTHINAIKETLFH